MPGHREFQVHHRLRVPAIEMKHPLGQEEQAECRHHSDHAQHGGDPQHQAHVPGLGPIAVMHIVVGNRQDRGIIQQRDHHDHDGRHGVEIEHQDRQRHEEQHPHGLGDPVNRIAVHALEDPATLLDRIDDHGQPGRHQHDGGRGARRIGGPGHSNAAIRLLQRRRIVDPVAGHADDVTALLQVRHDVVLVFREHLRETISALDGFDYCGGGLLLQVPETAGIQDLGAHAEGAGSLARDRQLIAGHHLDLDTHLQRGRDRRPGVLARGVEQRQDPEELPAPVRAGPRHAERAKAARRECIDRLLHLNLDRFRVRCHRQDDLRGALADPEQLPVRSPDQRLGPLVHRIKGLEMQLVVALQGLLIPDPAEHRQIDRVLVIGPRRQSGGQHDLVCGHLVDRERLP